MFDGLLMFLIMVFFAWEHPSELNAKLRRGGTAVRHGFQVYWAECKIFESARPRNNMCCFLTTAALLMNDRHPARLS